MDNDTGLVPLHIIKIILGFFRNTLTDQERDELDEWINANGDNQQVFEELLLIMMPLIPGDPRS